MAKCLVKEGEVKRRALQVLGLDYMPDFYSNDEDVLALQTKVKEILAQGIVKDSREFNTAVAYEVAVLGIITAAFI